MTLEGSCIETRPSAFSRGDDSLHQAVARTFDTLGYWLLLIPNGPRTTFETNKLQTMVSHTVEGVPMTANTLSNQSQFTLEVREPYCHMLFLNRLKSAFFLSTLARWATFTDITSEGRVGFAS
jgi:hypothetical protein